MTDTERLYKAFEDILYCRRPIIKPPEDKESGVEKLRKIIEETRSKPYSEQKEEIDEKGI